jgi:hypothetical protein
LDAYVTRKAYRPLFALKRREECRLVAVEPGSFGEFVDGFPRRAAIAPKRRDPLFLRPGESEGLRDLVSGFAARAISTVPAL